MPNPENISWDTLYFKAGQWACMQNPPKPHPTNNYTFIGERIEYEYSLDDQCRMEFDQGYAYCQSFQLSDPCAHLWCTHRDTPELCKTKKGPPMDGTACGKNKWCVNGVCESTSKSLVSRDGLKHNAQAGGWSGWSRWGDCSRTCGGGVSFRTRRCDNPRPAYGGRPCPGKSEEFRLCNIYRCIRGGDFRAEQCATIFPLALADKKLSADVETEVEAVADELPLKAALWLPYEPSDVRHKCKLGCYHQQTREYFLTGDNVIDGTACSYDQPSNICVQGACVEVGCDKILGSPVQEDRCGICAGDGSKCALKEQRVRKRLRVDSGNFTKVFLLPKGARSMEITLTIPAVGSAANSSGSQIHLILWDRRADIAVLDGAQVPGGSTAAVAEGTRFDYRHVCFNLIFEFSSYS